MGSSAGRYQTSNLYYAAFLKVSGVPYLGTEESTDNMGRRQVMFLFDERTCPIKPLKDEFFRDVAHVPALSYSQAIKDLKKDIFKGVSRKPI